MNIIIIIIIHKRLLLYINKQLCYSQAATSFTGSTNRQLYIMKTGGQTNKQKAMMMMKIPQDERGVFFSFNNNNMMWLHAVALRRPAPPSSPPLPPMQVNLSRLHVCSRQQGRPGPRPPPFSLCLGAVSDGGDTRGLQRLAQLGVQGGVQRAERRAHAHVRPAHSVQGPLHGDGVGLQEQPFV